MEKSYIAQIQTSNGCLGSGFIYTSDEYYYVFTAKHVIYGKKGEYAESRGDITINCNGNKYIVDNNEDIICIANEDVDIAIVAVVKSKLSDIDETLCLSNISQADVTCRISGYPRARQNENILSIINAVTSCDQDNQNELQLEVSDPVVYDIEADSLIDGFSGSGVFYENAQGVFAVAMLSGYRNNIKRVFCVNWNSINDLLTQNSLPIIKFKNIELNTTIFDDLDKIASIYEMLMKRFYNKVGDIHFERTETKNNILKSIDDKDIVVIEGDAGTGKSAIAKDVLKDYSEKNNSFIFAIKADSLDKESIVQLSSSLDLTNDLEKVINTSALNANNILYIDSAEQLLEVKNWDIVFDFINLALSTTKFKILISARSYAISLIQIRFGDIINKLAIHKINLITENELLSVANKYESVKILSANPRINSLLKIPFYLSYIIKFSNIGDSMSNISENDFRNSLWESIVEGAVYADKAYRSQLFMRIAVLRANQMQPFANIEINDLDKQILGSLIHDGLIVKENKNNRYAPAHDILEDMALCQYINAKYNDWQTSQDTQLFYHTVGAEPSIRRAYRLWATQKINNNGEELRLFVEQSINANIKQYWKDELLLVILRSNFADVLLTEYRTLLLNNNEELLRRCLLLMKVACKKTDQQLLQLMNAEYGNKYSSVDFLKPYGDIWSKMVQFIFRNKGEICIIDKVYIDFIIEWSNKVRFSNDATKFYPIEARKIGLLIVEILNCNRDDSDYTRNYTKQKDLIIIAYKLAGVIIAELEEIADWSINNKETYLGREIISLIQKDQNWVIPCKYIPDPVINILRSSWVYVERKYEERDSKGRWYPPHRLSNEQIYGFDKELRISNMGALGTPMFSLLDNHPWDSIKFVVELLNHSIDTLCKNDNIATELVSINIEIDGTKYTQKGSESLWCMYRGGTAECEILSSILMALEKVFLNYAKYSEESGLVKLFIDRAFTYLISNCHNIACTSVVASVLMAYPKCWGDKIFSILKIREFYRWDLHRYSRDTHLSSYTDDILIRRERDESNSLPHRKKSLREFMLELSIVEGNRQKCFDILDHFNRANDGSDEIWTLNLQQMDFRKQRLVPVSENQIMLQTVYGSELDEYLEEFNNEQEMYFLKPMAIGSWVISTLKGDATVTVEEWKEKVAVATKYSNNPFIKLESLAAIGIWQLWNQLSTSDKEWCIENIYRFYDGGQIITCDILPIIPSMLETVEDKDHNDVIKKLILRIILFYRPEHMLDGFYSSLKALKNNHYNLFYKSTLWNIANHYKDRTVDEVGVNNILNNIYELQPNNITKHNINQVISALKMFPCHLLNIDNEVSVAVVKVNEIICNDLCNGKYNNHLLDFDSKHSYCDIYAHYILNIDNTQERKNAFASFVETIYNMVNQDRHNHQPLIEYFDEVMLDMVVAIRTYSNLDDRFWQLWNCLLSFSKENNTRLFSESLMFKQGHISDYKISGWCIPNDKWRDIVDCTEFIGSPLLTARMVCGCGIDSLLPYILPCIKKMLTNNTRQLSDCKIYLEQIASKLFYDNKKRIIVKTTKMYSDSFIGILDLLIDAGSAKAFIIRDDFISTMAR